MVTKKKSAKQKKTVKKKAVKKKVKMDEGTLGEGEIKFRINKEICDCDTPKSKGGCSAVYGLGLIGALWYFISTSTSFLSGVIGILKAIFWPAFMVHGLLGLLGL